MAKQYETTMINEGGRDGFAYAPGNSTKYIIKAPGTDPEGKSTNPEQLFAAGYSSCFNSALEIVLKKDNIQANSSIKAVVSLYSDGPADFYIGVDLYGHIDGLDSETTQHYLEAAHQVCPYSKATRGNIEVTLHTM